MGRKKKKREEEQKPWCWYCDREFIDEPTLVQHQKNKHFKCADCHRKLNTAQGLCVHAYQVHKVTVTEIPGALPGREGVDREIFGMAGVPKGAKPGHPWGDEGEPSSKKAKTDAPAPPLPAGDGVMGSMGPTNGIMGPGHMGMPGAGPMGPGPMGSGMGAGAMGMLPPGPMGAPGQLGMGGPMGGPPPPPRGMVPGGPGPLGGYLGGPLPPPRPGMMGGPMGGPMGAPPGMGGPPMPPPRPGYGPGLGGFSGPPPPMRGPPPMAVPGPGPSPMGGPGTIDRMNGPPGEYMDGPMGGPPGMRPPGAPLFPIGQQGPASGGAPGSSGPGSGPGQPLFPVMGAGPTGPGGPGGPGMTGPQAAAAAALEQPPGIGPADGQQQPAVFDNMQLVWQDETYSMEERRAMLPKYAAARACTAAQQKSGTMGYQPQQPGMVLG